MNLVSRENTQVGSFEYSDPSERTERYRREAEALTELAGNPEFYHEPLADAFRRITESAARALNVSRVSIWRWNRDRTAIRCADLFESATGMHSSGMELSASSFPSYFHACRLSKVIAADDAGTDPRTSEFLDSYLRPLGISSMLDAPVHFQGRIDGVLCNEHVGAPRRWTEDEKAFTVAQANLVALTLERNERRQAEAAARRNLERFEMVARATIDLVYDWDIGDNVIWWSSKMNTLLGYGPEHTQNTLQFWMDRIHPHDRDAVEANLTDSLASSAEIFTAEYRFRKMDGTYACIQDRGFIQRDLQNRAIRMTGAMTDISARKAAEEELRLSERRFRSLIENLSDLITVVNREGLITYEGPSSIRVLGIDPEQMSGHAFLSFIHPEDRESAVKAIDLAFSESTGFSNTRFRWRHADGSWRLVESLGRRIAGGEETSVVLNSRDITRSKDLEDQFRQAQKMEAIGRLSGGVAHDFNNLLSVIIGHASLIEAAENTGPEILESLHEISAAADRASGLTRQLLTFSRRQRAETRLLDFNEQVSSTIKMIQRVLGEDIALQVQLENQPTFINGDPGMLDQVIMNLCVNARDAMPRGGRLSIQTALVYIDKSTVERRPQARAGLFVCLTVADTGCGIPREILPRIFEPFFTTKDAGKGTGLGLATVYGIVGEHNGWVEVDSKPQQGANFQVFLPAVPREDVQRQALQKARKHVPGGDETILIVEDEASLRALVKRYLTRLGYSVLEASSGAEALDLWRQIRGHVHLVFTDLVMPGGLNGIDFIKHLAADDPNIKALYTSGYSAEISGAGDLCAAGAGFIPKPYKPEDLALAVRKVIDNGTESKI